MNTLRLILILSLLAAGLLLAWRSPWKAVASLNGVVYVTELADAPLWAPPAKPPLSEFKGKISPHIDKRSVELEILPDRETMYWRFAAVIVALIFLYGTIGMIIDTKPVSTDAAYCFALTLGFLGGSLLCLLLGRVTDQASFGYLNLFWAGGMLLAFILMWKSRRRIDFSASGKPARPTS